MSRRLRSLADREAILALGLAGAGFLSLEVTLPAAGALAVRSIRTPRSSDGTGPAVGVLVFGVAWLSFLLGYPTLRAALIMATEHHDPLLVVAFVGGWVALAVSAWLLANFLCRCHPERSIARSVARAGLVSVIAAGMLQFFVMTSAMLEGASKSCGDSLADCVGSPPWASIGPALAVGATWLGVSLAIVAVVRARRGRELLGRAARA